MTFFLWPPANQLEPAHQPDRLDGSLLIGIYSAVIASILYAVAADSEAKGARGTAASWCAVPAPFARAPQEPAMIDHKVCEHFE